jgi:uncharacterized membrane protein
MHTTTERGLSKARIEALSDGVFAIAMTLLILEVKIPSLEPGHEAELPRRLLDVAPRFLAYAMSFLIVGVNWVGHHAQLHYIRRTDRAYLWTNLFYLLAISSLPFSAGLLGQYPRQPASFVVYCGNLIASGLLLFGQFRYAAGRGQLFDPDIDPAFIAAGLRRILMGPKIYLAAAILSFFSPTLSLLLCILTPMLYMIPGKVDRYWHLGHRRS